MKRTIIFLIAMLILPAQNVFADSWDDYADLDRAWDGQKTITNKEFEQAMDLLQQKQKRKEARQKKRKAKKISGGGTSLHSELNPDKEINEVQLKPKDEGILINLPIHLIIDGKTLDKGYYKVIATKDNDNKIFINFYQSQFFMGKIEATETEEDFNQENVDFAEIIPYKDSFVKMVFGGIDFNAYAIVPYEE